MPKFSRCFSGLGAIKEVALSSDPHWLKDLLALWRPSGVDAGDLGLRLAVRENSLNFYRRGQSVAKVAMGRELFAKTHIKYVAASSEVHDHDYVTLRGRTVFRNGEELGDYRGRQTLELWIAATRAHIGPEKFFVDELVGASPNVIDLEMGLPASEEQTTAPRIDLVALEALGSQTSIVFWEAKLSEDARVRCRAPAQADLRPEVLRQLAAYRQFLGKNKNFVEAAYVSTARLIVELRQIADSLGTRQELGEEIKRVARDGKLIVDNEPRLVVRECVTQNATAWAKHADKLQRAGVSLWVASADPVTAPRRLPTKIELARMIPLPIRC